jgi:hypothetical protein
MTVNPATLEEYDGKQVILTLIQGDGSAAEYEGKIEAASAAGVAFKEKGKRDVELVEPSQIEEISLAPVKPKSLPQKKLKPVTESTARQHLLDRHGWNRSDVNGMTDEQAFADHEDTDHDDLGHRHVEPDDDEDEGESEE